ncbi:MAG: hypothetical protein HC794_00405 [Nitrospiraceae bacterium]|nr:hypothetical protein [Nitrospiraceae bacterium]
MAQYAKPRLSRAVKTSPAPYSEHQKKVYDFATAERTVRSGGVTETLSNIDIMVRKQFEAGVSGKTLAQRDYIREFQLAQEARRAHIEEQCIFWSEVKAKHQRVIDNARAERVPIPWVLPHPDDIIIDWTNGVRLPGPLDEVDWKRFDQTVRMRDALFVQQAMEDCVNGIRLRDRPTLGAAGLLGFLLNQLLPPSLRLTDFQWIEKVDRLSRLSTRDCLKDCRAAWRKAGVMVARGKQFGTREKLTPMLAALRDLVDAGLQQKADPQGYEEALQACALATDDFRRSAPKMNLMTSKTTGDKESCA